MSARPTAAPAIWPYPHRTVAEVDRDSAYSPTTALHRKVWAYLSRQRRQPVRSEQIASELRLAPQTVRVAICRMRRMGAVIHSRPGPNGGFWRRAA